MNKVSVPRCRDHRHYLLIIPRIALPLSFTPNARLFITTIRDKDRSYRLLVKGIPGHTIVFITRKNNISALPGVARLSIFRKIHEIAFIFRDLDMHSILRIKKHGIFLPHVALFSHVTFERNYPKREKR